MFPSKKSPSLERMASDCNREGSLGGFAQCAPRCGEVC
jgi:hypothetical protein